MKKSVTSRNKIVRSILLGALVIGVSAAGFVQAQGVSEPGGMQGQGNMPGQGGSAPGAQTPKPGQGQGYEKKGDRMKKDTDMDRRGEDSSPGYRSGGGSGGSTGGTSGSGSGSGSSGSGVGGGY